MTLFGVTLDGAQMMSLASLLLLLVYWLLVLKRERSAARHINDLAARNVATKDPALKDSAVTAQKNTPDEASKGPWG